MDRLYAGFISASPQNAIYINLQTLTLGEENGQNPRLY